MKKIIAIWGLVLGLSLIIRADSWALPETKQYCSENKKFCLKVEPKKLGSQLSYFQDKVDGKENAGAAKEVKDNYCKGTFSNNGKNVWKVKLDNEVSPVNVLVSNNGDYVVTFDNWHGLGYGDNVVTIYNASNGNLIKKLGLSDFLTESDIDNLPHSISSIWWSGKHQIDYKNNHLILKVVKPGKEKDQYFDVRINLLDGSVLDEKIDRLASLQFLLELSNDRDEKNTQTPIDFEPSECPVKNNPIFIKTSDLLAKATYKEIPKYSPAARATGTQGIVITDVLISESGEVECAKVSLGHALLKAIILRSIKKWKFEKSNSQLLGRIIIEGKSALVLNGKIVEEN